MDTVTIVLIVVNVLWLVPAALILLKLVKKQRRNVELRRHLLETGRSAPAVVVKVEETGPTYGRVPHLAFVVRVEPPGEPPFEANARAFFRMIDFPRVQVGAPIEVRFDPSDRSTVAIVGDTLA